MEAFKLERLRRIAVHPEGDLLDRSERRGGDRKITSYLYLHRVALWQTFCNLILGSRFNMQSHLTHFFHNTVTRMVTLAVMVRPVNLPYALYNTYVGYMPRIDPNYPLSIQRVHS